MTTEEKAKRYDEVLENIKELYSKGSRVVVSKEEFETIFPELKESEDELTWLTNYIQEEAYSLSMDIRDNEDRVKLKKLQRSLAWLKKQPPVKFNDEKDEKIRKELLESFKYQQRESRTDKEWLNGIKISEVVAWIEKQVPKPKWSENDEHHWMMCLECVEECATQEREDFSKTIDWLKSIKKAMEE